VIFEEDHEPEDVYGCPAEAVSQDDEEEAKRKVHVAFGQRRGAACVPNGDEQTCVRAHHHQDAGKVNHGSSNTVDPNLELKDIHD